MIDFGLEACPLCGGEAEIVQLAQGPEHLDAVIKCTDCGLTLEWETEIKVAVSRSGKRNPIQVGPNPIEAWNRRAFHGDQCKACAERLYCAQIATLNNCNDCGRDGCEYQPGPGQHCRINCPLWQPQKKEA